MASDDFPFQTLTPYAHKAVIKEARERSRNEGPTAIGFENRAWALCSSLHPSEITLGRDPLITINEKRYRPDVFALFDQFGILVEVTYTIKHSFIIEELTRMQEIRPHLARLLRQNYGNKKLVSLLFVQDTSSLQKVIVTRANRSQIKIISERELDYYLNLHRSSGIGIYQLFFSRMSPSVLSVSNTPVPAIRIKEGRQTKYIFSVNPHELMKRTFISHRELHAGDEADLGYQRMLKKKKLQEIASYINTKNSFPSPIIVSFQKNAGEYFEEPKLESKRKSSGNVSVGDLRLPSKPATIYIVDGQHRLYGYSLLEPSEKHHINVIAYKGLKPKQQASMFVDINLKQTKVPSTLLWELYPDILSQDDDDFYKAVISRVVERLIPTHLEGKIKHTSSGSKGPLTFHALCNEISRARLITKGGAGIVAEIEGHNWDALENRLHTILSAFFDSLFSFGKNHPDVNPRFFLQNSGMIPLIRELGKICRHLKLQDPTILRGAKSKIQDRFEPYFELLYEFYDSTPEQLDDLTKKRVGSSGFIETEDEMDDYIRERIPSFPLRAKRTPPELKKAIDTFTSQIQSINKYYQDEQGSWVFKQFDKEEVIKSLSKPARDAASFEKVLGIIYQELVESSGGGQEGNRAARLLGKGKINEIGILQDLALLRHLSAHRVSQLEPSRRKRALRFLGEISGRENVEGFGDFSSEECLLSQINLLNLLSEKFLKLLLSSLHSA